MSTVTAYKHFSLEPEVRGPDFPALQMKTSKFLSLFCALTALAVTLLPAAERPNVVIIYGDDVGYGDLGVYGSKLIPTPNLDKLAREGLIRRTRSMSGRSPSR